MNLVHLPDAITRRAAGPAPGPFPPDAYLPEDERTAGLALDELINEMRHRPDAGFADLLAHLDAEAAVTSVDLRLPRPVAVKVIDYKGRERCGRVARVTVNWFPVNGASSFCAYLHDEDTSIVASFHQGDELVLLDGAP